MAWAASLLDAQYLQAELIIRAFAIIMALSFTCSGITVTREKWWMNRIGEEYPKSKLNKVNNRLSSISTFYFVTLYASGTTATKLFKWGIMISSYFVAINRAVIPSSGSRSTDTFNTPSALSMIFVARNPVSSLKRKRELNSNIHEISFVRLQSDTLLGSRMNLGTYWSSF